MTSRLATLDHLVKLRLRADKDPSLDQFYQFALREARPNTEEFEYIDRQVQVGRAGVVAALPKKQQSDWKDLPSSIVIEAFRGATPLSRLYSHINRLSNDWSSDQRARNKAYVFACFSELAYLHLAQHELPRRDRYKIFPSITLRDFIARNIRIDVRVVFPAVGDIEVIEVIETQWFVYVVLKTTRFIVVAVRGTVSLEDWGINLNALKTQAKDGGYHRGFYREAQSVLLALEQAIEQKAERTVPLYFTGHSLGGAVAGTLATMWRSRHFVRGLSP
jgi:hypothetical protein